MLVRIRNLDIFERSIPTPVNTSIPIKGNETVEFTYPKAYDSFFMNLKKFNFAVECISQIGDVRPSNPNLDYSELVKLIKDSYALLVGTEVCDDGGIHVAPEDMWVTGDEHQALLAAYEYAISVNQETETQDEIDQAVKLLQNAKEKFENARQYGTGVDEALPKISQYGFCDDGLVLEALLDLGELKDNSFFFKLNKPLEEDTVLVASLTINGHTFETEISVDRHPEFATRSVTTVGETIVWSLGTGVSDTDIDMVDGMEVAHFTAEWPQLPNTALLTVKTAESENLRGVDERLFVDREIQMVKNKTDNHVVTELNFKLLDRVINESNMSVEGIVTSELNGDDIDPTLQWVTPDQLSAFKEVIEQASSLKGVTENQSDINDTISALETAKALFESQKRFGKKGPFVLATTLIEDAKDDEDVSLYSPGFNVEQNEYSIVARGTLAFIESYPGDTRETHYHLPLHLDMEAGRVVVVYDIDEPKEELSHTVVEDGGLDLVLPVDDGHRDITFKVCRNEEVYNEKVEDWIQTYTVNCTLVTLADELPYITGVAVPTGMYEEKFYSELFDGSLNLSLNSNRIASSGTANYIDHWVAYGTEDVHWFVPVELEGLDDDMVIKCFTRDDPEVELKHYVVGDDKVLVTAISPSVKSRHIIVYRNTENYESDERGQEYILDFSGMYLSSDPDPIKSVTLMTEGGWKNKQYADLVSEKPAFEITKEDHTIRCTGEFVWTDWPELVGGNSGTHHFLPMRILAADGLILSWYNTDTSPTETKHFTINDNTRDIVAQLTEGAPKKKIVIYTSMDAHNVQRDGVEYILDCSEVVFQPKPFIILPAADEDELKDALTQEPDYDGKVHVELTQEVELSDKLVLENPVELSGETTLTAPNGIDVLADTTVDDLTIVTESDTGMTIGDDTHAPVVEMNNVTFNFAPTQAGPDDKARGIVVNSAAYSDPTVTIKDSEITATPLSGKLVRAIELASNSTVDGHGSLTLDHTSVETSGNGDTCIVLNSPNAEVVIENDSTITNKDYEGILVGYNGSVTVDHSKVDAVEAFFIDSLAGCETKDATIEIKNESDIVGTNNWAPSGSNNTAVITIDNATNCTVHLDATSSIVATGGGTASNNEYVGALIGTKDNTIYLEGSTRTENNVNQFWFIHSREDSDALLYDKAGNGDNLVIVGTAAAKAYVINKDTGVSGIALLSVPKSDTINVTNDLDTAVKVAQAAQQGVTTNKFVIDMGRFADDSGNDDIRMTEGITFKGYSNYITIEPLKGTTVFDILPSNFQYDVQVLENGRTAQISGTLLDIDLFEFSNDPEFQEGHYLALKVSRNANVSRITISNEFTGTLEKEVDSDGILLLYVGPDKSKKINLNVSTTDGLVTVELDIMDIRFEDGSGTHYTDFFTVAPRTEDYWNKMMSDVQSKVEVHETTGMSVSLSGTLHYVDEWNEWNKGESGNFLVLDFTPVDDTKKLTFHGGQVKELDDNVLAYKVTDPSETFSIVAEDSFGEHEVEFSLSGLVLEPKPEKLFSVSIPEGKMAIGDKTVADLQDLTLDEDKTITGKIRYVNDFKVKSEDIESVKGNYFAIKLDCRDSEFDQVTFQYRDELAIIEATETDLDDIILARAVKGATLTVKQTLKSNRKVLFEETYTLNAELLNDTHFKDITVRDAHNVMLSGKDLGEYVDNVQATVEGTVVNLTGTLYQFSKAYGGATNYAVPFSMTGCEGQYVSTKQFNDKWNDESEIADPYEPILQFGPDDTTRELVVYATAEDQESKSYGTTYTINASKVNFLKMDDFVELKVAEDTIYDHNVEDFGLVAVQNMDGKSGHVTGTLEYNVDVTPFTDEKSSGYYLPLDVDKWEGSQIRVKRNGSYEDWLDLDDEKILLWCGDREIVLTEIQTKSSTGAVKTYSVGATRQERLNLNLGTPSGTIDFYGKQAQELQDNIKATNQEPWKVTGTLHYVTDYEKAFPNNPNGNFLAMWISSGEKSVKLTTELVGGTAGEVDVTEDKWCVYRITDKSSQKIKITATLPNGLSREKIYDLSGLVMEGPSKLTSVKVADLTHSWKDVTYSQVMADDVQANLEGHEIAVTGTLLQKDGWSAYKKDDQNKWYPVLNLSVENDKNAIAFFKDGERTSVHHFESGKPNDDVIFVIDNDTKDNPRVIKVYQSEGDANSDVNGTEYTIDFSGCNLLTNVPAELEFEMADQSHSWKGVSYSDIQSKDSSLTVENDTLKITGTFYKVNGWSAFGKKNQDKWYIATKVTRPSDAVVEGSDKRSFLANKVSDDIVYAFDGTSSKPSFKVYPTAKNKELDFAGRTYTMDLSEVTLVDPYVKLSINTEKTYDIDDPTKLGDYTVEGNVIKGTAHKYFGSIQTHETKPECQTGYYLSVVADPWEGVEANKNDSTYVPLTGNGKVLYFLGQMKNDTEKISFKNTKANSHIDTFTFDITCEKDDSIPSVDKIGYFATKDEFNHYLTEELHLGEDSMNVDDQIFYIHYNAPLDNATDYVTFVEVNNHKYGVAHKHVEAEETVTYFSMKNGFQVDYVDDAVKTKENSTCDLTDYHGPAKVSLYRVDGEVDPATYPSKMDKMVEYTVNIP